MEQKRRDELTIKKVKKRQRGRKKDKQMVET